MQFYHLFSVCACAICWCWIHRSQYLFWNRNGIYGICFVIQCIHKLIHIWQRFFYAFIPVSCSCSQDILQQHIYRKENTDDAQALMEYIRQLLFFLLLIRLWLVFLSITSFRSNRSLDCIKMMEKKKIILSCIQYTAWCTEYYAKLQLLCHNNNCRIKCACGFYICLQTFNESISKHNFNSVNATKNQI